MLAWTVCASRERLDCLNHPVRRSDFLFEAIQRNFFTPLFFTDSCTCNILSSLLLSLRLSCSLPCFLSQMPGCWETGRIRTRVHSFTSVLTHTQSFTSIVRALEMFLKETASPRLCWHPPASGGKLCTAVASRSFSAGFQNTLTKRDPAATCWEFWLRPRSLICLDNLA